MEIKVKVIKRDHRHREWIEPFDGIFLGMCIGGDGAPYALVVHPDKRILLIPLYLLRYDNENLTEETVDMKSKGLYQKYKVEKISNPEKKMDCIVLEWDDPLARKGIDAFAMACASAGYNKLSRDLHNRLAKYPEYQ